MEILHQKLKAMKKNIVNLLFSGAVLLLTCSFAESPAAHTETTPGGSAIDALPVGGAYLMFAGKFGGEITRKEIAEHRDLEVDGCAKGSRIFKFTLDITQGGKITSLQSDAGNLTKAMLSKLKSLSSGDSFEFKKTKAYLPNGKDVVDVHAKKFVVV